MKSELIRDCLVVSIHDTTKVMDSHDFSRGKPALFKLDTGAEVTAVSDEFFWTCSAVLQKPSQPL